jgi:flagellar motor switch protein FliN/FliY
MSADDQQSLSETSDASAESAAEEVDNQADTISAETTEADQTSAGSDQGGLPDWAVRQIEALQGGGETEKAPSRQADELSAQPSEDTEQQLPDWAAQRMAQMQASEMVAEPVASAAPAATAYDAPVVGSGALDPAMAAQIQRNAPNLEMMLDLPLDATVELGRAELPLAQVLSLQPGSVIQLDRLPGEPLDLLVNGQLVARGEIVVLNDTFAFRITELVE